MPSGSNPFEFPIRARAMKDDRAQEINMRALEDFLGLHLPVVASGGSGGVGARWTSNESEDTFSGTSQFINFAPIAQAYSEGFSDYMTHGQGETPERGNILIDGFYTATVTVTSEEGGDFFLDIHAVTAAASGEEPKSLGNASGIQNGPDGRSHAIAFSSWAMQANDYFRVRVVGTADDTFHAYITIEYVGPYGGQSPTVGA